MKVAVLGGGPSAFYFASRLLQKAPFTSTRGRNLEVHVYDRLWAPHGLVRYGVAPDHPEVKNCTHKFDETAQDPRFKFFGNVNVGVVPSFSHTLHLSLDALRPYYTHVILAYGAGLPFILPALGASAISALSIVHWYTGHPSNPHPPRLDKTEHLTLMGHGNVSLDIARLLLSSKERLAPMDIPQPVLDTMQSSKVKHISIVSRRGPAQVAFTAKELRELLNLPDVSMVPIDPSLLITPDKATRQQSRILDLLRKGSAAKPGTTTKTWSLEFFRSPISPIQDGMELGINELDEHQQATPTGRTEQFRTDLIVNSVGYRSEPLKPEWYNGTLGRVRQMASRVMDEEERPVENVYASGWAANGAKGVLATTMMDAYAAAERVLEDTASDSATDAGSEPGLPKEITNSTKRVVSYEDWKRIDAEEVKRGEARGKERERLTWTQVDNFLA